MVDKIEITKLINLLLMPHINFIMFDNVSVNIFKEKKMLEKNVSRLEIA